MTTDIAFSVLSADEGIARQIQRHLPAHITSFLYTTAPQEVMVKESGIEAFTEIFRNARLCVILFRGEWGHTRWTRLERQTITDRYLDDGASFLVFVRLDDSDIPAWFPRTDLWMDYATYGPQQTAEYIAARLKNLSTDLDFTRRTRHSADRRPIPIARYQTQIGKMMVEFTAVRPEVCDACTAAVEFRPVVRVTLSATDSHASTEETLCPRCARERGIEMGRNHGLDTDALYSYRNPSFVSYLDRILGTPILPALSADPDLRVLGVTNVGAGISPFQLSLYISIQGGNSLEEDIPVHVLQSSDVRSDTEIIDFLKTKIIEAINQSSMS